MLLLQPCEGTQRVSPSAHSPRALDLCNDSPVQCRVTSPDGQTYSLNPNQVLSVPVEQQTPGKRVTFSVNRGGRTFTVYGELAPSTSPLSPNNENHQMVTPPSYSKRPPVTTTTAQTTNEDSLLLSTENLINARLGHAMCEETSTKTKSPHAKLSAMQSENSKRTKANLIKQDIAEVSSLLYDAVELCVKLESSFDLAIKEKLWDLLHTSYDPSWFSFAISSLSTATTGEGATIKSKTLDYLCNNAQLRAEPSVKRQGAFSENNEFKLKLSRFLASQLLQLVLFLDRAKRSFPTLFPTCLFRPGQHQPNKSSDQVLQCCSTLVFHGESDLQRALKRIRFSVSHKQTALEEYDSKIPPGQLVPKVRDGVVLSMLLQSYTATCAKLLPLLRVPARERLHCIINNEKLLDQLVALDPALLDLGTGRATKYDLVDGKHPARILELIWKIVLRFGLSSVVDETKLWKEVRNVAWKHRNDSAWQSNLNQHRIDVSALPAYASETTKLQRLLLLWVQTVCATFPVAKQMVTDFSASLSDGAALCLVVNYYHPSLLPLDQVYLTITQGTAAEELKEAERMRLERRNFGLFNTAVEAIGEVPVRLSSHHYKHPLPAQLGFSSLALLASRILGTICEVRAAQKIQTMWAVNRAKKLGTQDSASKAKRMVELEHLRNLSDQEDSRFEGDAVQKFFQRVAAVAEQSPSPPQRQPQFDENSEPPAPLAKKSAVVASKPQQMKQTSPAPETPFQREQEKRKEAARRAEVQFEAKRRICNADAEQEDNGKLMWEAQRRAEEEANAREQREAEMRQQLEWQQRVKKQQHERWLMEQQEKRKQLEAAAAAEKALQERQAQEQREQALREEEQQAQFEKEVALREQALFEEEHREDEERRQQQVLYEEQQRQQILLEEQQRQQVLFEEQQRQQALFEERQHQQALFEEQQRQQALFEEQQHQQALFEEQQRQQALFEEQQRQQALFDEEQRQQALFEEQQCQQALFEEQQRQKEQQRQRALFEEQQRVQRLEQEERARQEHARMVRLEQEQQQEQQRRFQEDMERAAAAAAEQEERKAKLEQQKLESLLALERSTRNHQQQQMDSSVKDEIAALAAQRKREENSLLALEREHEYVRASHEIFALETKQSNSLLLHEELLLEERIERQSRFLQMERARIANEREAKLREVERLEQMHREEAKELQRVREIKLREKQELEELRVAKSRVIEAQKQQIVLQQQQEERVCQVVATQAKEQVPAITPNKANKLMDILRSPARYHALDKRRSSTLWENRNCCKMLVLALRKCTRSESQELASLLSFATRSYYRASSHQDLVLHVLSALIDVLQTFYDQEQVFALALLAFDELCPSTEALAGYGHRLSTLHDLLQTKLQIQRLCAQKDGFETIARNLKRLQQVLVM